MDFTSLFTQPFSEYAERAFTSRLLVFLHMPKAAGTSVVNTLEPYFEHLFEVDWRDIDRYWGEFLQYRQHLSPQMVRGHFWHEQVRSVEAPNDAVVFLRDPIKRLVSEYRYSVSPVNPPYLEYREENPTFEHYVEKLPPNAMADRIVGFVESFDEYVTKAKELYRFIGLTEKVDLSVFLLLRALGISRQWVEVPHDNVTPDGDYNRLQIKPETLEQLQETQALDIAFFNYIRDEYEALSKREDIVALLEASRISSEEEGVERLNLNEWCQVPANCFMLPMNLHPNPNDEPEPCLIYKNIALGNVAALTTAVQANAKGRGSLLRISLMKDNAVISRSETVVMPLEPTEISLAIPDGVATADLTVQIALRPTESELAYSGMKIEPFRFVRKAPPPEPVKPSSRWHRAVRAFFAAEPGAS